MTFIDLALAGVKRIELDPLQDKRGFFARAFCAETFQAQGLFGNIAQVNTSFTSAMGTVRGLHFQRAPAAEAKLVRVVRGAIFDVVVDLRAGSPSYGSWLAQELTADNRAALYIPEGFAHGFQTLTSDVEMTYLHSVAFAPEASGGLRFDDPHVGVDWPSPVTVISPRDLELPALSELEPLAP